MQMEYKVNATENKVYFAEKDQIESLEILIDPQITSSLTTKHRFREAIRKKETLP